MTIDSALEMTIDTHQHMWTEPLLSALARRRELPFVRDEHGLTVLYLAGERPFVLDLSAESREQRARLVERDRLERALVCLSSPLGAESLPRAQSRPLLDAYHDGALALGAPFAVWGAVALDRPDPDDVDRVLERGCVGVCLPAGALADVGAFARMRPLLARLEARDAPLFVHPGPGAGRPQVPALCDPLWWPALTRYVHGMHTCWLAFLARGRALHPRLRVVFAMLAGLAPLHRERLGSRGGPVEQTVDPLAFYDTSSYGPSAIRAVAQLVGAEQLLYGSDRPVLAPGRLDRARVREQLGFDLASTSAGAALRLFAAGERSHELTTATAGDRSQQPTTATAGEPAEGRRAGPGAPARPEAPARRVSHPAAAASETIPRSADPAMRPAETTPRPADPAMRPAETIP